MASTSMDNGKSVCVVALPKNLDPIRLVGDEDKHATILFFGDMSTLPADAKEILMQTVQNTSLVFNPFREQIVSISRLGDDDPPALVAMLSNNVIEKIRETLLVNPKLGDFLSNTPQYPNYTPHVTLAYPDYQGENKLRNIANLLFDVKFDRLALWWGDEQIEFSLGVNYSEVQMSEKIDKFLAHHGVKGMKWGVRRSQSSLDRAGGRKSDPTPKGTSLRDRISMRAAKPGSVVVRDDGKVFFKTKNGSWKETHLSADAERVVKTNQKASHEMSDREIKEAVGRARLIEDYNKLFGDSPNAELKAKVEKLDLEKKYTQTHAELHPSAKTKVVALVASSAAAYGAYNKLNNQSNGELNKQLRGGLVRLGMVAASTGKHALK